jgi:hypothetical protein
MHECTTRNLTAAQEAKRQRAIKRANDFRADLEADQPGNIAAIAHEAAEDEGIAADISFNEEQYEDMLCAVQAQWEIDQVPGPSDDTEEELSGNC